MDIRRRSTYVSFTPLHDRVLVRRIEGDAKTSGGLIIPDTAKEKPQEGEIVAVGAGARDEDGERIAMDVKAGDRILFGKWSGTEIKLDGEDLMIMKESDILGVMA
nr:co-chaperone GroES [Rhodovulum visakhapatnamense]